MSALIEGENIGQKELERAILLMIFSNSRNHPVIFDNLKVMYFQNKAHRDIFQTCKNLFDNGEEITTVLVENLLEQREVRFTLLDILLDTAPLSVLCRRYVELLFQNWFNERVKHGIKSVEEFEFLAHEKAEFSTSSGAIEHISHGADEFEKDYQEGQKQMISTYFNRIDEYIGSFLGGDYIALGASTGTGKTSIALNISMNVCFQGKKVLYCSLEMTQKQLRNRFVCLTQGLDANKYRSFGFNLVEMDKYREGLKGLNDWPLHILTDYQLTPEKLRIYAKSKNFDFIVIDYLGLMSGGSNKSSYERVTAISRQIKLIATELNVPILVLVQLNRDLKGRQNKRPVLSDIRESGAIEQDADFILFAHRESMYNEKTPGDQLELIIAKNRHGKSGKFETLNFDLATQRIKSRSHCG